MASYSTAVRKSMRWYKKVAEHILFGTCIVNAYVMYKHFKKEKLSITNFKENVCLGLMGIENNFVTEANQVGHHHLKESNIFVGVGKNKRRQRKVCRSCFQQATPDIRKKSKNMTKVATYCNKCPGTPFLCKPCFEILHK